MEELRHYATRFISVTWVSDYSRDHRTRTVSVVLDHRTRTVSVVLDHRTRTVSVVLDHRTRTVSVVLDHRSRTVPCSRVETVDPDIFKRGGKSHGCCNALHGVLTCVFPSTLPHTHT